MIPVYRTETTSSGLQWWRRVDWRRTWGRPNGGHWCRGRTGFAGGRTRIAARYAGATVCRQFCLAGVQKLFARLCRRSDELFVRCLQAHCFLACQVARDDLRPASALQALELLHVDHRLVGERLAARLSGGVACLAVAQLVETGGILLV